VVVVAASAGGLTAIAAVLGKLPVDFPLPIAVVQHMDPNRLSILAELLARRTPLQVRQGQQDDCLQPGVVYIAPPGRHMTIDPRRQIELSHSEPVHFLRPSADPLFESAAQMCMRVVAIILTGTGSDGSAGAAAVKAAGGFVIAQDEASSAFFGMPQAAIAAGVVDLILPLTSIGPMLVDLVRREVQ
jgi:two-component system chemotaxis response regulator CheB